MILTLNEKYLAFPVNPHASRKKICFYEEGKLIYELDCRLDNLAPTFTAYAEMTPFLGKTVELRVNPEIELKVRPVPAMELPGLFEEPFRPQIHFTTPNGWNNDPNGLIRYGGEYHLFYQYNPCSPQWDNMHWGHAVSKDLLHWEHLDTALYPDEDGMMYSGCAIEDRDNRSGLGDGTRPPMLIYYTAAAKTLLSKGKKYTQRIGVWDGRKVVKCGGAPAVDHIVHANRDPKVVWVEELGRYVMALYLTENKYRMLSSEDLVHWDLFTDLELPGDRECPDLYPLTCDGEKKWIFCGASDIYAVGSFTEKGFVFESEPCPLQYSPVSYAAQSYSGTEDEGRVVRVAWHRLSIPEGRFSQQMGLPVEMGLSRVEGRYYLSALPLRELNTLRRDGETFSDRSLATPLRLDLGAGPADLDLRFSGKKKSRISIFGCTLVLDPEANLLTCERWKMPLSATGGDFSLRIVADRASLELFADGGRFCMTVPHLCDYNLPWAEITSGEGETLSGAWYRLASVYR